MIRIFFASAGVACGRFSHAHTIDCAVLMLTSVSVVSSVCYWGSCARQPAQYVCH